MKQKYEVEGKCSEHYSEALIHSEIILTARFYSPQLNTCVETFNGDKGHGYGLYDANSGKTIYSDDAPGPKDEIRVAKLKDKIAELQ